MNLHVDDYFVKLAYDFEELNRMLRELQEQNERLKKINSGTNVNGPNLDEMKNRSAQIGDEILRDARSRMPDGTPPADTPPTNSTSHNNTPSTSKPEQVFKNLNDDHAKLQSLNQELKQKRSTMNESAKELNALKGKALRKGLVGAGIAGAGIAGAAGLAYHLKNKKEEKKTATF